MLIDFIFQGSFFIVLFIIAAYCIFKFNQPDGLAISTKDLVKMINQGNAKLVDIRDEASFNSGYILSSVSKDAKWLLSNLSSSSNILVIICQNGSKSFKLAQKVMQKNQVKVFYLQGGIVAWSKSNLPMLNNK